MAKQPLIKAEKLIARKLKPNEHLPRYADGMTVSFPDLPALHLRETL